jgi:hypothetical protein
MRRIVSLCLVLLLSPLTALAVDSKKAAYVGGTAPAFKDAKKQIEGTLVTSDEKEMRFLYNKDQVFSIPYDHFIDMEYGKKSGRRVGATVATTILLGPLGLLTLMSKKQKHFLTVGYTDAEGKEQVAVFELGKDLFRTTLPILEARSGKKVIYQDNKDEKKKSEKK